MSSIDIRPIVNAASFGAFAFFMSGATPAYPELREQPKAPVAARYSPKATSPSSSSGSLVVAQAFDANEFKREVSAFYAELSSKQTDLEPELQRVLLANISSLYEE